MLLLARESFNSFSPAGAEPQAGSHHLALTLLNLITKLPFLHLVPSQRLTTPHAFVFAVPFTWNALLVSLWH